MSPLMIWFIIIGMGVVTYLGRASFIVLLGSNKMPPWFERGLRFVPPAVLSALVLPAIIYRDGVIDFSTGNLRLLAAILAAISAWYTKSILATIVVGMGALWLLQYII